ncbi:DNA ligase [Shewanella dokdonensis]|uniref:DNA ligase n=1 Tax=Shewanella dokdonensis TaxID=712036 RepID=A0ABX8DHH2_9GAMM|nr:DNA ligase [Shewanella dokdonensis]MCL1074918.1 DNA ligase [Shewanella dokdonensis]QVK23367.1 DNA ligase [Shewanella dokdonensis]
MRLFTFASKLIGLFGVIAGWLVISPVAATTIPAPELAKIWQSQHAIDAFLVSEKLDGVRARWDGKRLLSRSGLAIDAPAWFTAGLPEQPLEGELWGGYGSFDAVSAAARSQGNDEAWRVIKLYLFDAPTIAGGFAERYQQFASFDNLTPYLKVIPQREVTDNAALQRWLKAVLAQGGEGLMLHRRNAIYTSGRSDNVFKLKAVLDDEAQVLAILPGKGKYQGMMGALLVETALGVQFRIGSGFSDAQRANPPAIGSWITFAYSGMTSKGKPRFARFLRVRSDYQLSHDAVPVPEAHAPGSQTIPITETEPL